MTWPNAWEEDDPVEVADALVERHGVAILRVRGGAGGYLVIHAAFRRLNCHRLEAIESNELLAREACAAHEDKASDLADDSFVPHMPKGVVWKVVEGEIARLPSGQALLSTHRSPVPICRW